MPEGAVYVGRPSKWANAFVIDSDWMTWTAVALGYRADVAGRRAAAVALHRAWLLSSPVALGPFAGTMGGGALRFDNGQVVSFDAHARSIAARMASMSEAPALSAPPSRTEIRAELGGKPACCWCPVEEPCHADVLLEIANG